jgi:hypothetical protein
METPLPLRGKPASTRAPIPPMVYGALVRVLGRERAEIVDFYIDSRLAIVDPERYERAVEDLLGEGGGRLVIRALRTEITRLGRTGKPASESLLSEVRMLEKAFAHPTHPGTGM